MTKTEARRKASMTFRFGHYNTGRAVYVHCPDCHEKVERAFSMGRADLPGLKNDLVEHLVEWCKESK